VVLAALAATAAVAVVIVVRNWRRKGAAVAAEAAARAEGAPDLGDEDLGAERLPESGWLELAREMMARGDRRLALRALFLASLALLAERGLIGLARHKSNRDYLGELGRRAHALPRAAEVFGANVGYFEDSWYGRHEVTDVIAEAFLSNQEALRSETAPTAPQTAADGGPAPAGEAAP
jgi:hypothetical protein